jgi:hypothetical protein
MLRVIRSPKGQPYATFNYDGTFSPGGATFKAIQAFQTDHKTLTGPPPETSGKIDPNSRTFKKLVELLPATHKELMTIENLKFVYLPGTEGAKAVSEAQVNGESKFVADFKTPLAKLIRDFYAKYKIVLSVVQGSGSYRTFAQQRAIMDSEGSTNAGPGESNHNWGNGADLGFKGFQWIGGSGDIVTDDEWLQKLSPAKPQVFTELWKLRNALTTLHRSGKQNDLIHIQTFSDANVSMGKSLAKLMSECGRMYWSFDGGVYKCNFGLADKTEHFSIGSAKNIWDKKVNISEPHLAKALNQAIKRRAAGTLEDYEDEIYQALLKNHTTPPTEFTKDHIKKAHCDQMRTFLRQDFDFAEVSAEMWTPVNK